MKKGLFGLTAALLCLCLCACGSTAPTVHTLHPGDGEKTPETIYVTLPPETVVVTVTVPVSGRSTGTAAPEATEETPSSSTGFSYVMKNETQKLGDGSFATLTYPQLQNTGNPVSEQNSNLLLAGAAIKALGANESTKDYQDKVSGGSKVTFTVTDCQVTACTPALVSVRFAATYLVSGQTPLNFVFTYLLNPSTGSEIKGKNVFSNLGGVLDALEQNKATQVYATAGFDKEFRMADWIKYYRDNILYKFTPELYFTSDAIVLIAELSGNQGGWAEYSIPLDAVSSCLKVKP